VHLQRKVQEGCCSDCCRRWCAMVRYGSSAVWLYKGEEDACLSTSSDRLICMLRGRAYKKIGCVFSAPAAAMCF
jgi:hypothetical protein